MAPELKTFYDRNLLERLLPLLVFMNFGQVRPMPAREGQTVNFRRFNSLPVATTPLALAPCRTTTRRRLYSVRRPSFGMNNT